MLSTPAAAAIAVFCLLLLLGTFLSLPSLLHLLVLLWRRADDLTHSHQTFRIPRRNGDSLEEINPLFRKASAYLSSLHAAEDSDNASLFSSPLRANDFSLQLSPGQTVLDCFLGSRLSWTLLPHSSDDALLLCLRRHDRHRVLRPYLQHVEAVADDIELRRKEIKLYTNGGGLRWKSMAMTHPANFDTIVMDTELMGRVRSDLEQFLKGRAYYTRLGRLWKRSYLLYGPPGTGKSTFVAAMARFLCYDIYELDLSHVSNTADLRSLLLDTSPRSIILVEHIDRYLAARGDITRLLCFMDGLFSCCGEGRVMVFTASWDKETLGLDPAVLRPGRVDVHIHFPLCDFASFKKLACHYLGLKDHKLYAQVEGGFQSGGRLSPAEVGEIMLANRSSPSRALKSVINALHLPSPDKQRCSAMAAEDMTEVVGIGGGGVIRFGKDATVREWKKLYGLVRMRNVNKREGAMQGEIAAGDLP